MNHVSKCMYLTHNYTVVSARASSPIHILHTAISHVIKVMERQFLSHAITIGIHVNCFDHTQCAVCKWTKKACKHSTVYNPLIGDLTQLPTFNHVPWHSLSLVFHMVYFQKSRFCINWYILKRAFGLSVRLSWPLHTAVQSEGGGRLDGGWTTARRAEEVGCFGCVYTGMEWIAEATLLQ